jgi:hypothetical protein
MGNIFIGGALRVGDNFSQTRPDTTLYTETTTKGRERLVLPRRCPDMRHAAQTNVP